MDLICMGVQRDVVMQPDPLDSSHSLLPHEKPVKECQRRQQLMRCSVEESPWNFNEYVLIGLLIIALELMQAPWLVWLGGTLRLVE